MHTNAISITRVTWSKYIWPGILSSLLFGFRLIMWSLVGSFSFDISNVGRIYVVLFLSFAFWRSNTSAWVWWFVIFSFHFVSSDYYTSSGYAMHSVNHISLSISISICIQLLLLLLYSSSTIHIQMAVGSMIFQTKKKTIFDVSKWKTNLVALGKKANVTKCIAC